MSFQCFQEDSIVTFKFDHGKLNSISLETLKGLNQAVKKVNNEEALKGLIITGEGRFFSSGFDLETFTNFKSAEELLSLLEFQEEVMYNLFTCKKPVISAINGHATAAGLIICMASDYRIAINNSKIKLGMTEITYGMALTPAEGEIMRFGLDTGKNFRDVIFSGKLMSPVEALERGIVDQLVADENELLKTAKVKICNLIDTSGRPFILLKALERSYAAERILGSNSWYDPKAFADHFLSEPVQVTLKQVKAFLA